MQISLKPFRGQSHPRAHAPRKERLNNAVAASKGRGDLGLSWMPKKSMPETAGTVGLNQGLRSFHDLKGGIVCLPLSGSVKNPLGFVEQLADIFWRLQIGNRAHVESHGLARRLSPFLEIGQDVAEYIACQVGAGVREEERKHRSSDTRYQFFPRHVLDESPRDRAQRLVPGNGAETA